MLGIVGALLSVAIVQVGNDALAELISPPVLWFYLVAPPAILVFLYRQITRRHTIPIPRDILYWLMIVSGQVLAPFFYFSALDTTDFISQSVIYLLYPAGVILWLYFSGKERLSRSELVVVSSIFVSQLFLITVSGSTGFATASGVVYLCLSAAFLVCQKVLHKRIVHHVSSPASIRSLTAHQFYCSAVASLCLVLVTGAGSEVRLFAQGQLLGVSSQLVSLAFLALFAVNYFGSFLRNKVYAAQRFVLVLPFLLTSPIICYVISIVLYLLLPQGFPLVTPPLPVLAVMVLLPLAGLLLVSEIKAFQLTVTITIALLLTPMIVVYQGYSGFFQAFVRFAMERTRTTQSVIDRYLEIDNAYSIFRSVDTGSTLLYRVVTKDSFMVLANSKPFDSESITVLAETHSGAFDARGQHLFISEGNRSNLRLFITGFIGKSNILKAVSQEGIYYVIKPVSDDQEIDGYKSVEAVASGQPWFTHSGLYKSSIIDGYDRYLVSKFKEGITFAEFYGLFPSDEAVIDLRGVAGSLLERLQEVVDAERHLAVNGLTNRDIHGSNLIVSREGRLKMVDYDMVLPLDPKSVVVDTLGTTDSLLHIVDLLFPRYLTPTTKEKIFKNDFYLQLTDNPVVNQQANSFIKYMRKKAIDGSYYVSDGCLLSEEKNVRLAHVQALDRLSKDIVTLHRMVKYNTPVPIRSTVASSDVLQSAAVLAGAGACGISQKTIFLASEAGDTMLLGVLVRLPSTLDSHRDILIPTTEFFHNNYLPARFVEEILPFTYKDHFIISGIRKDDPLIKKINTQYHGLLSFSSF